MNLIDDINQAHYSSGLILKEFPFQFLVKDSISGSFIFNGQLRFDAVATGYSLIDFTWA
jgi:hypothetical protein